MTPNISDRPAIHPTKQAHIAICPGCESPVLASDLCTDSAAMQCPRCGTFVRPKDLNAYILKEAVDE